MRRACFTGAMQPAVPILELSWTYGAFGVTKYHRLHRRRYTPASQIRRCEALGFILGLTYDKYTGNREGEWGCQLHSRLREHI